MSKALNAYAGSVRALIALHHGLKKKKSDFHYVVMERTSIYGGCENSVNRQIM